MNRIMPGFPSTGAAVWATAADDNKTRDAMKPILQGDMAALSIVASLLAGIKHLIRDKAAGRSPAGGKA
jgi:hypothetical protein